LGLVLSLPAAKLAAKLAAGAAGRDEDEPREPWLRPYAVIWTLAVLAACGWTARTLGPKLVERELLRQLSLANGAPVEAGEVRLSLWSGELQIDDLQIVDPLRLDRDRLHIGRLSAKASPGALVRGRFETDKLIASKIRADVARRHAAAAVEGRPNRTVSFDSQGQRFEPAADALELNGCLKQWPEFCDRLAWLGRLAGAIEQLADLEKQISPAAPYGERSRLSRPAPRVQIAFVRADDLADEWKLGRDAMLEIVRLSSRPESSKSATRMKIAAPELDAQLTAELEVQGQNRRHRVQGWAYNWQLADLVDPSASHRSVIISNAKADLQVEGWMTRERCELELDVDAKALGMRFDNALKFAGLDADTWNQGIERLRAMRAEARLAGPWTSLALTVDRQRLVEQFKHQLRAAGEHELVQAIDQQLSSPPAAEPTRELAAAAPPEQPEDEFFTISDEASAPPAQPEVAVDGWRRAKGQSRPSAERLEAAAPLYPKTNAPDSDPADRLLARLANRSTADATEPEADAAPSTSEAPPAEPRIARRQPSAVERRYASGPPRPEGPLPGPINLVVGQYERPPMRQAETPQWPRADAMMEEPYAEPAPQSGFLSRMATGARDALRRIAPSRKPTPEYDLPPDLPAESDAPSAPYLGPEEPIDEAPEQRQPARESMLKRWFR
jgi:hypothetical protein